MSDNGPKNFLRRFVDKFGDTDLQTPMIIGGSAVAIGVGFLVSRYRVCSAEQMMVRTGLGIKGMSVSKSGIVLPLVQKHSMVPMTPIVTNLAVNCLSNERIPFVLPVSITAVPMHPDEDNEGFMTFCRHFNDLSYEEIRGTIRDMVEGDIRLETSKMPVTSMLEDKDKLHRHLKTPIQEALRQIGLAVKASNIKEVTDTVEDDTKYLFFLRQKAIKSADFTAQKEVKNSETGMRIELADLDKQAVLAENARDEEKAASRAALAEAEALERRRAEIASVEANVAARQKKADLEQALYLRMQEQETERRRMEQLTKARVDAEARIAETEGEATSIMKKADAVLYQEMKKAEGIKLNYDAQADGLRSVLSAAGENPQLAQFHLALEKDLYERLAKQGAAAVQGLKPDIRVWNTGNSTENPMNALTNVVQSLSPLFHNSQAQGGMTLPDWLPKFSENEYKRKSDTPVPQVVDPVH